MRNPIILPLAALALILSVSAFLYGQLARTPADVPTLPEAAMQAEESASAATSAAPAADNTSGESPATDAETPVTNTDKADATAATDTDSDATAATDTGTSDATAATDTGTSDATAATDTNSDAIAAPDFSMLNADGESVHLSDFLGTPVVLNFWATWCPPCRGELPHFADAYADYGGQVTFLMTDLADGRNETIAGAQAFLAEQGYVFPVCYDTEMEGAYAYGVNAIPATYFINADGTIHSYQIGALDRETLYDRLEKLLE